LTVFFSKAVRVYDKRQVELATRGILFTLKDGEAMEGLFFWASRMSKGRIQPRSRGVLPCPDFAEARPSNIFRKGINPGRKRLHPDSSPVNTSL
jgi:hypothetical protein